MLHFHALSFSLSLLSVITQLEIAAKRAGTLYDSSIGPKGGGYDDAGGEGGGNS